MPRERRGDILTGNDSSASIAVIDAIDDISDRGARLYIDAEGRAYGFLAVRPELFCELAVASTGASLGFAAVGEVFAAVLFQVRSQGEVDLRLRAFFRQVKEQVKKRENEYFQQARKISKNARERPSCVKKYLLKGRLWI